MRMVRMTARVTLVAAMVAAVAGYTATAAHAADATIEFSGAEIVYRADTGQVNVLIITKVADDPDVYGFDDTVPITSDEPDCVRPDPADATYLECEHEGTSFVDVDTKDLDDTIDNRTTRAGHLNGGSGNDIIHTGGSASSITDVAGADGNDTIYSGPAQDWINGGTGVDTVSFAGRIGAVTADVAGGGGVAGEDDHYDNIENLTGGGSADVLTGDDANNVLDGGTATLCIVVCLLLSGNDTLHGAGGNDTLYGQSGADNLYGEAGADALYGGAGYDALDGGPGNDLCLTGADGGTTVNCGILTL